MMRAFIVPAIAIAALLSGCVTPLPPASATRFHRIDGQVTMPAGIYEIAQPTGLDLSARPDPSYAAAVASQLDRLGHRTILIAAGQADYRVDVRVERSERAAPLANSPVSVGVGAGTGSYGSGLGVGVGINLASLLGGGNRDVLATRLLVRITRRGEAQALWEGRAETFARTGTPAAGAGLNAQKLAEALFAGFPGRSGETITVP
ncbi:MAG: hypothetical protein AABZ45_04155 [Pseudomonadota bacterium]